MKGVLSPRHSGVLKRGNVRNPGMIVC